MASLRDRRQLLRLKSQRRKRGAHYRHEASPRVAVERPDAASWRSEAGGVRSKASAWRSRASRASAQDHSCLDAYLPLLFAGMHITISYFQDESFP